MGAVRIPAPDAAERTKLLEDLHDRHFFALQVLFSFPEVCHFIKLRRFSWPRELRSAVLRSFISEKMRSHSEVSAAKPAACGGRVTEDTVWEALLNS